MSGPLRRFTFDSGGPGIAERLTEDPVGAHVWMRYQGRELLGTVQYVDTPREANRYQRIGVKHFNGETWPIEPLASEVFEIVNTTSDTEES